MLLYKKRPITKIGIYETGRLKTEGLDVRWLLFGSMFCQQHLIMVSFIYISSKDIL